MWIYSILTVLYFFSYRHCAALHGLNHLGPEGYHWRVCVEEKGAPVESSSSAPFSWWDIQDENAKLPVKQASQSQLKKFFSPRSSEEASAADAATKAAKGAFKSFGKVVSHAVGTDSGVEGPPVAVVAFKLLDLVKMHDDFIPRGGSLPQTPQAQAPPRRTTPASAPPRQHQQAPPQRQPQRQQQQQQQPPRQAAAQRQSAPAQEASLMDFGPTPTAGTQQRGYHHTTSSPATMNANETRAEKLKREYAKKQQTSNRVWDDVDQRWVEVDPKAGAFSQGSASAPPGGNAPPKKKEVGITLDPSNAVGKSAHVQAAVNKRVNDMKQSTAKAVEEVRAREEKKKAEEAEEDEVRKRLTPSIKAWSEEHGKKKQLRALLASLHTILWPGAKWKQISIGDVLDDKKVKLAFHKASRVVHPDKTHHLDAEKRFLAKRIFDALSQAKTEFDEGKR